MKRWTPNKSEFLESLKVDAFLAEVIAVCRKHGMSIGHEDGHGAFIVYDTFSEFCADWLRAAHAEGAAP